MYWNLIFIKKCELNQIVLNIDVLIVKIPSEIDQIAVCLNAYNVPFLGLFLKLYIVWIVMSISFRPQNHTVKIILTILT